MKLRRKKKYGPRQLMTGPYLARNPAVIGLMATADLVGLLAASRSQPMPSKPLNVLVANLAHLGDIVNLLPLLQRLRASSAVAKVGVLAGPWSRSILENTAFAHKHHYMEHLSLNRGNISFMEKFRRHAASRSVAIRDIGLECYDVAVDAYPYFGNSADTLWSAGVPIRIGFTSGGASTFYTHRFAFDPTISVLANQNRLIDQILGEAEVARSPSSGLPLDPEVERNILSLGDYIVFHVGRGEPHRSWPKAYWIELGRRLVAKGLRIVFTGQEGEAEVSADIRSAMPCVNMIGQLSFNGFATVLSRARGLVAVDTVAGHIAARFCTPTVVIQNGTLPPHLWKPNQPFVKGISTPVECSPCNRSRGCPNMDCIRAIPPAAIETALDELMTARLEKCEVVHSVQQISS